MADESKKRALVVFDEGTGETRTVDNRPRYPLTRPVAAHVLAEKLTARLGSPVDTAVKQPEGATPGEFIVIDKATGDALNPPSADVTPAVTEAADIEAAVAAQAATDTTISAIDGALLARARGYLATPPTATWTTAQLERAVSKVLVLLATRQ